MKLVVDFDGLPYYVDLHEDSPVSNLKNQLALRLGIPARLQQLTLRGNLLENELKVLDYQITPPSLIFLRQIPLYEIKLSYPDGNRSPMKIFYNTTIDDVKMAAREGVPSLINCWGLELMHGGVSLENQRLVRSYKEIRNGSELKLIAMFEVKVTWGDMQQYRVEIHGENTVEELKDKLRLVHEIQAPTIRLFLTESMKELKDHLKLKDYGITRDCELLGSLTSY